MGSVRALLADVCAFAHRRAWQTSLGSAFNHPGTMSIARKIAPPLRRHALRDALPGAVRLLAAKHAHAIEKGFIDDYVALDWLEWRGGTLKLTTVGENICKQLAHRS